MRLHLKIYFVIAILLASIECQAIDNPSAPNYVASFEQSAKLYEEKFENQSSTTEIIKTNTEYTKFLQKELDKAYVKLLTKLSKESAEKLRASQRAWLAYYKAEVIFVSNNWTVANFGTSSALSRSQYQSGLLKSRVRILLYYLQNYQ